MFDNLLDPSYLRDKNLLFLTIRQRNGVFAFKVVQALLIFLDPRGTT